MQSKKRNARIAGVLYLLVIILGVFAEKYVRTGLIELDHSEKTISNIIEHELLFRLGFLGDLGMQFTYFLLAIFMYSILKNTCELTAKTMLLSVCIAVDIMCLNMLNQYAPLLLLSTTNEPLEFTNNLVVFYIQMHSHGYHIAQLFFGFWLLPLGFLITKSKHFPSIIGYGLIIGCFGYLLDFIIYFLSPETNQKLSEFITAPADIAEISLCLFLLVAGIKQNKN
ncbi:MAG: DUF4386 domain-containing protein [Maribacter dokdonensis]|uniref:DUF4386 domain-containing protein n=1 Tax=Maribacter dokdonensis TaxID=320912 RepID=UPI003297B2F9